MSKLSQEQIKQIRDLCFNAIDKSSSRRAELVESGKIEPTQSLEIEKDREKPIKDKADELNGKLLVNIVEDMQSASQKIDEAKNKLEEAFEQLQNADGFISLLTTFFNVVSTIVSAAQSGNPLNLVGLLNTLN